MGLIIAHYENKYSIITKELQKNRIKLFQIVIYLNHFHKYYPLQFGSFPSKSPKVMSYPNNNFEVKDQDMLQVN